MGNSHPPTALFIENNPTIARVVLECLDNAGWEVRKVQTTGEALSVLKSKDGASFPLVISGVSVAGIAGDEILKQVSEQSPLSQRMMIIPVEEKETLIRTVNTAGIHSCVSWPFEKEVFISQLEECWSAFEKTIKEKRYKRLIKRQNRQLYDVAKQFKYKKIKINQRIVHKKTRILQLQSKKRKQDRHDLSQLSLDQYIRMKKLEGQPAVFLTEFELVSQQMKSLIIQVTSRNGTDWSPEAISSILHQKHPTSEYSSQIQGFHRLVLSSLLEKNAEKAGPEHTEEAAEEQSDEPDKNSFEYYVTLELADDQLSASLVKQRAPDPTFVNLPGVLDFLRENQINYGIVDDADIQAWIEKPYAKGDKIEAAQGLAPVKGTDGKVTCHFQTGYTNPGKILEDGSIDFKERGDVPYVTKGALLAVKKEAVNGTPGINIHGLEISVDEVVDPLFAAESGCVMSEDGLEITADVDGQPGVDAMGNVTVSQELVIEKDVDYETGNIYFQGNIIVKGVVKAGFVVKGISLTAKAIDGGIIDLSGDLHVSDGMTNAKVVTVGNVFTKFINNCNIFGFGDFTIQKEIIDSTITLSGRCEGPAGHVIASSVSAKNGIEAKNIGTVTSRPPVLRVGIDDHINGLEKRLDEKLEVSLEKRDALLEAVGELREKETAMQKEVTLKAHIQDRSQLEINDLKKELNDQPGKTGKTIDNPENRIRQSIKQLKKKAQDAEAQINILFDDQDKAAARIEQLQVKVEKIEEKNVILMQEKKHLQTLRDETPSDPTIIVQKTIVSGTQISSPNAALILDKDNSRCMIQETLLQGEIMQQYELAVKDLKS